MKKVLLSVVALLAMAIGASAMNYTIDDSAIDALVENSVEASTLTLDVELPAATPAPAAASLASASPDPIVATLLTFFLGGFGIHRHYLGTRRGMWAIYTFTCGGIFGIVPTVDFIIELVYLIENRSFAQFVGNTRFFMWAN